MPGSRVFTQFDVGSIVEGYNSGPTAVGVSFSFVNSNFGNFEFTGSGTAINPPDLPETSIEASYQKDGVIDFQGGVNPIPDDALITRVRVRTPAILNASGVVSGPIILADYNLRMLAITSPIGINVNDQELNQLPVVSDVWNEAIVGSDADVIFDYSASPIDLATLITLHGSPTLVIGIDAFFKTILAGSTAFLSYNIGIYNWELEVTWTNIYQWLLSQPDEPISEGDTITLTSPDDAVLPEEAVDFEDVTQIDVLIPDPLNPGMFITVNVPFVTWTLITPRLLRFTMPSWGGLTPTVIRVVLTSTQFSGTLAQQLYTINFVSASGIYELVPGKTSDTLYIELEPGETIDVKIPNPFGRTGFFGM